MHLYVYKRIVNHPISVSLTSLLISGFSDSQESVALLCSQPIMKECLSDNFAKLLKNKQHFIKELLETHFIGMVTHQGYQPPTQILGARHAFLPHMGKERLMSPKSVCVGGWVSFRDLKLVAHCLNLQVKSSTLSSSIILVAVKLSFTFNTLENLVLNQVFPVMLDYCGMFPVGRRSGGCFHIKVVYMINRNFL